MKRNSEQPSPVLEALLSLRPSGAKSFEQLICLLLSDLSGVPFRRVRSGHQGGIDARSEDGVGVEVKRYGADRSLDERELLAELDQVASSNADLQAWVLATTQEVTEPLPKKLESKCEDLGLALILLDRTCGHPLPYPAITALASVSPERLREALSDDSWRDRRQTSFISIDEVAQELRKVRDDPRFEAWADRLKNQLKGLPTWERVRREQNLRLRRRVLEDPYLAFGTVFNADRAVPREVEKELTTWIESAEASDDPPLCVVLGERYDGKTWAVLHWLLVVLESLPLPVFFLGSKSADRERKLIHYVVEEVAELLNVTSSRAESLVKRFRRRAAGSGPWVLIILDGLNEYHVHPEAPFDHMVQASSRFEREWRAAALIATARSAWWAEQSPKLGRRIELRRINVGPYSDAELADAIGKLGEDTEVLNEVPASARPLLRRPRYLGLVIEHKNDLRDFGVITTAVLQYLDATDKMRDVGYLANSASWDHRAYSDVLRGLARTYLSEHGGGAFMERRELNLLIEPSAWRAALQDLESAGVVTHTDEGYCVHPDRLATGMGLWLPKVLMDAARRGQNLREMLRDLLEPIAETEEQVGWLKAGVTFTLLRDSNRWRHHKERVLEVLVDVWLRSRNLGEHDLDDVRSLAPRLVPPLLRLAERTWSEQAGDRRLQEISLLVFRHAAREELSSTERQSIGEAARAWCRLVPKEGTRFLKSDDAEAEVRRRLDDPTLTSIRLRLATDEGALGLQRVSLHLETVRPGLLDSESILAAVAVNYVANYPLDSAERRVVRQVLARPERAWFEQRWTEGGDSEAWRAVWFDLVRIAERADLAELEALVAPPVDPESEKLWARWQFTREDYLEKARRPPAADDNVLRFAAQSRHYVIDPDLPRPLEERVRAIANRAMTKFSTVRLQRSAASRSEDHEFRDLVPALSAWSPATGTAIVQGQVADLPKRFGSKAEEQSVFFTHLLDRNAVAVRGRARQSLRPATVRRQSDDHRQFAAALAFVALMPGLSAKKRVDIIIDHPLWRNGESFEWRKLYELAAFMADRVFMEELLVRLEVEEDPKRTIRLRLLAVEIGDLEVGREQQDRLFEDICSPDAMIRYSAVATAAECSRTSPPADALLELVRNEDQRSSLTPRYAAWLLAREGHHLAELPVVWQAEAAVRHPERRELFLREVEYALSHAARSEAMIIFPENIQIQLRGGGPVNRTVGVGFVSESSTIVFASRRGGVGGLEEPEAIDPDAERGLVGR